MKNLSRKLIVSVLLLGLISQSSGCKPKENLLCVLPFEKHPMSSFEPMVSVPDTYEASGIWSTPYEKLDNSGIISSDGDTTTIGFSSEGRILLTYVGNDGTIKNSDTLDLPIHGDPVSFFEDTDTLYAWIRSGEKNYLADMSSTGKDIIVSLPDTNGETGSWYSWMDVLDHVIYTVYDQRLLAIDMSGSIINETKLDSAFSGAAVNEHSIFILENTGEYNDCQKFRLTQFSRDSFKKESQIEFIGEAANWITPELFPDNMEDSVLLNMETGIFRCRPKDKSFELLVNLKDYGISDAGIVSAGSDHVTFAATYDILGERKTFEGLIRCSYSESDIQKQPIRTTLFLVDGDYIPILAAFNRSQSEYYCEISDLAGVLKDGISEISTEEDLKRAFLDVLTNKNDVDLFFFRAEDLTYFTDNHVLMDINEIYTADDAMIPNILKASDTSGSRYYVTPFYSLLLEAGNGSVVSAEDMGYSAVSKNQTVKRHMHSTEHKDYIELDRVSAYIRKELSASGKISEDTLKSYLNIMRLRDDRYYENLPLHDEMQSGAVLMLDTCISRYEDYAGLSAFLGKEPVVTGPWGYSAPAICAGEYLGVSEGSKNLAGCQALLSYLFSYDVQYTFAGKGLGLPIRKDAFEDYLSFCAENSDSEAAISEFYETAALYASDAERASNNTELEREVMNSLSEMERGAEHNEHIIKSKILPKGMKMPETKQEYFAIGSDLQSLISSAEEYYLPDKKISDILYDEYLTFRSGTQNEDAVVKALKSRLELYWAERST
ncbi:MAG: hypothetical protein J5653_03785 [Clostridiales bacterium]|nr:hypothetical protein [Clostridiales bacterium]